MPHKSSIKYAEWKEREDAGIDATMVLRCAYCGTAIHEAAIIQGIDQGGLVKCQMCNRKTSASCEQLIPDQTDTVVTHPNCPLRCVCGRFVGEVDGQLKCECGREFHPRCGKEFGRCECPDPNPDPNDEEEQDEDE